MEIKFEDIARFTFDVNLIHPLPDQLLFLDELSTDNRAMLRKKIGFCSTRNLYGRVFFRRGARISLLAFLGVGGIVENCLTEGTFDRDLFFTCCQTLLDSGKVQRYPVFGY
eukprot:Pompholyxophrys_sp_v1_NODE_201_length_1202_cov_19.293810.p1 type:complete len:111 gc:universal NODE_201_length_1202_cov_19.293810:763-431(-)